MIVNNAYKQDTYNLHCRKTFKGKYKTDNGRTESFFNFSNFTERFDFQIFEHITIKDKINEKCIWQKRQKQI